MSYYKFFSAIIVSTVFCLSVNASGLPVSGKITDEKTGGPLEYVNIVLLSMPDSVFIAGTISNGDGHFRFDNVTQGEYLLKISYIGYESAFSPVHISASAVDVGNISLKESSVAVAEVIVTPPVKPFRTGSSGGVVANVASTLLSTVGTAGDVLQRMPGVTVVDDQISVFGKGNPITYINNRRVRDNQELQRLESSEIATVELITNPGAKYDAEGRAVLLIKTKKKQDGFALQVSERLTFTSRMGNFENANFSFTKNNLNLFASYYHFLYKMETRQEFYTKINSDNIWEHYLSTFNTFDARTQQATGGFDWTLSDKHIVGGQYRYLFRTTKTDYESNNTSYIDNELYDELDINYHIKGEPYQHLANVFYRGNYSENFSLEFDFDYLKNHDQTNQKTYEISENEENRTVNTFSQSDYNLYAGKLVNSLKTGAGLVEFGGEYNRIKGDGFLLNPEGYTEDNIYTNKETKAAAFVSYSNTFGSYKISSGLRYEFTHMKATENKTRDIVTDKDYHNLYPNIALSKSINDWQLSLSFNSRVQRPQFSDLNGNTMYINRFTFQKGNPYLEKTDIYDVNWQTIYKMLYFNAGFTYEKNPVSLSLVNEEGDASGIVIWTFRNYDRNKELYASLNLNHTIALWKPNYTVAVRKPFFKAEYNGETEKYNEADFSLQAYNDFVLPFSMVFSMNFNYRSDRFDYLRKLESYKQLDIGLRKFFFDRKLRINIEVRDLFDWVDEEITSRVNNIAHVQYRKRESRYGQFTITYQFNNYRKKYQGTGAAGDDIKRF